MEFPIFKYHPDPLDTGAVEVTDEPCECCNKTRGYRAVKFIYAEEGVESICPWCIADGSASEKFDGHFSDGHPLASEGISDHIIAEVCNRTPSFNSWQQERWLSHCGDACAFLGDADLEDLKSIKGEKLKAFLREELIDEKYWQQLLMNYEKGGSPAIYKFKCLVCSEYEYYMDFM